MSFFQVNKSAEAVKDSGGSYITKGGIYPIKIKFVSVKINEHGARSLDFNFDFEGTPTTIYGLKLDNNNGTENFQRAVFNKLCVIAGLDSINEPESQTHKVGRDGTPTEFQVLDQFTGLEVYAKVKFIYSVYDGKIREQREFQNFYDINTKATAAEIVSGTTPGGQYEKDLKNAEDNTYRDGLTIEQVDAWKKERNSNNSGDSAPAQSTAQVAIADNPF